MSLTYHICQGGLTAALLARAITDPIITVTDDYTIGPLQDIDAHFPRERAAFYSNILHSLGCRLPFFPDPLTKTTLQLAAICSNPVNIVLWSDDSSAAQLLRLRLCGRLHHHAFTGSVFDVRIPLTGHSVSSHIRCPLPLHSETGIRLAARERLPPPALSHLARDWASIASQPSHGIRLYQANRWQHLTDEHYDDTLRTLVATHRGPADELLSKATALTGQSTLLCLWRYSVFVQAGTLQLTGDPIHAPATAVFSMT